MHANPADQSVITYPFTGLARDVQDGLGPVDQGHVHGRGGAAVETHVGGVLLIRPLTLIASHFGEGISAIQVGVR